MTLYDMERVVLASQTLESLEMRGKNVVITDLRCPRLEVLRCHGYACKHITHALGDDAKARAATLLAGCPRLREVAPADIMTGIRNTQYLDVWRDGAVFLEDRRSDDY